MSKRRKISVGEIIRYLYYLDNELSGHRPPERILRSGVWYHEKLGFNQPNLFQKYFKYPNGYKDEYWLVRGVPDRIEEREGKLYVGELKTIRKPSKGRKKRALEVGSSQANIYCWLTGAEEYEVYLYTIPLDTMEIHRFDYDEEKAKEDISEGIRIKKELERLRRELKSSLA